MDGVCRDVIRCLVFGMLFSIAMASGCTKDGFFGDNCDYECHCDGGKPCDKQTGVCPNYSCANGWSGEYCQRGNAAKGKPSQQSSTWSGQTAHYGNDGHHFTSFTNCANTQYQSQPWWKVDLGKDYVIFRVRLLNSGGDARSCKRTVKGTEYRGSVSRTNTGYTCKDWSYSTHFANTVPSGSSNYCRNPDNEREPWCYTTSSSKRWDYCDIPLCQQLHSFKLWVDSKEYYNYQGTTSYATYHTIGFQSPPVGRHIKIEQTKQSSLTLCELQMEAFQYRACTDKRYGPNCNNRCRCANDAKCDDKTGKCPSGCNDRFTGPYCNIEIPSFIQVGASTPTSIKFQWRYIRSHDSAYNAGTVTKYVLRYSYKPGSIESYGVTSPSGTVEANVTGLKPSTRYSFGLRVEYTVASSTAWNEGKPSRLFSTASCSAAEVPEDFFPSMSTPTNTDATIMIKIPRMPKFLKWGTVSKLIIVVEMQARFRRRRSALIGKDEQTQFTDYKTAKANMSSAPVYIAAKLAADFYGYFIIGDGMTYDGYYNPPLVRGEKYDVIFGMVFVANNISTVAYRRFGKFISVPTEDVSGGDSGVPVWLAAIALTVGILGILAAAIIPAAVIMVWKKRDQRMKTYESPMRINNGRQSVDRNCSDGVYEELGANTSSAQPTRGNVPKTAETAIYENTRAPAVSEEDENVESPVSDEVVHEQEYANPSFDLSE